MAKTYAKLKEEGERRKATEFYVSLQIVGTPQDCLDQIRELQRLTGLDHLITEFAFGGLPHVEGEANMRLFARSVLPVLQKDPAFAVPVDGAREPAPAAPDLFAPA
jgi:alkanesulfonate monooxygenase SsuD/methylene tetrahydromethanopterin reductase-like flavin-dependent oxidoreductase (luciferase family)